VVLVFVQDLRALLTAREAAGRFHTSIAVVLMWRNRGWLDEDGQVHTLAVADRDWRGRPLYRWGDLLDAERGSRQSRKRTGLPPRARLESPYDLARCATG